MLRIAAQDEVLSSWHYEIVLILSRRA